LEHQIAWSKRYTAEAKCPNKISAGRGISFRIGGDKARKRLSFARWILLMLG
jgi:hypothetical protein